MKLTADTITAQQICKLRGSREWSTWWLREFAIALREITTVNEPAADYRAARTRCAELLNVRAKCAGRTQRDHAPVTCSGTCCTNCGGPIDENAECRC